MDTILLILFLIPSLLYFLRRAPSLKHVPRPPIPSWLWGHDLAIYSLDAGEQYRQWFDKYGPLFKIRGAFWHPEILIAADLGVTKHILQTNIYDYHHSKIVRPRIDRLLGRSLGWVEGADEHRRMRKLVSAGLSANMMKALAPVIYDSANRTKANLVDTVVAGKNAGGGCVVNILDWTAKTTLEITGRASFDHDFSAGESADAQSILQAWRRMATVGIGRKGLIAITLLRRFPFLNHIPIKANRAHSIVKTTIQDGVAKAMLERSAKHKAMGAGADASQKDLLSLLMNAHAEGALPTQELLDHISMFIMAGHETTAQTLSYTILELARHPAKQARLRDEILAYGGDPGYDDFMGKLPYLDAVCRESLRIHPALPYMERVATKDDTIPLATPLPRPDGTLLTHLPVTAGQIIVTPIISIQQQARVWGADAAAWTPERWLEEERPLPDAKALPTGWGNLLAFSDGPRNCVGWRLGLFQYKVILMVLLRDLVFVNTGADIASKIASTLQPCVRGAIHEGPNLPVEVRLADSD